jgi:PAS domain S-box-containing protein
MQPPIRVALVDDDVDLLAIGGRFLRHEGDIAVSEFADPTAFLPRCGEFDVIVSDYEMPRLDGISLLKAIRGAGNDVPFILFTGKGREEIAMEALNNGATFYLQKGADVRAQFAIMAQKVRMASQNRRLKEQQRQSEERLRLIESSIHDMLWQLDAQGRFIYISPNVRMLLGYEPEEVLGRTPFEFVEDREKEATVALFMQNLGKPFTGLAYGLKAKNGSVITFDVNGAPLLSGDGSIGGYFGSSRNVSDKMVEENRSKNELRRLSILDGLFHDTAAAEDETAVLDPAIKILVNELRYDGCAVYENAQDVRMARLRTSYPERLNGVFHAAFPYERIPQLALLLQGVAYYTNSLGDVLPELASEGFQRAAIVPISINQNVIGGLAVVSASKSEFSEDERKTLDMVSRELGMMLDRVRTQQRLQQMNRRLSLMSSIIRHDLHNQILVASGHLTIAQDSPEESESEIRDALVTMNRMEEMLRFSRHYQNIGIESPRWFNPKELWGQSLTDSHMGGVRAECTLPPCLIQADPMVVRVLPNLMDNSLRHGGRVSHICLRGERQGEGLQFTYEDNGVGLSKRQAEKIFDIQYQGRHGHGLHLVSEVLGITEITIEAVPSDAGARFILRVPPNRCRILETV